VWEEERGEGVEEGEEETESRSGLLGTKVELIVSGEDRCSTRRRFEYAKKKV
jgi:hypothetical protein